MFSRTAFISGRTPPVPKAFPKSATVAGGEQKEEDEEERIQLAPYLLCPETSRAFGSTSSTPPQLGDSIAEGSSDAIVKNASRDFTDLPALADIRNLTPLKPLYEGSIYRRAEIQARSHYLKQREELIRAEIEARSHYLRQREELIQAEKTSSIAAEKSRKDEMVPPPAVEEETEFERDGLAIKVGKMVGEDMPEYITYPMLDIEHKDSAMITRVKDLLGPSLLGEDVVLGEPFVAEHEHSMGIVDDESLCAVLVTNRSRRGTVRVSDLANLKKTRERWRKGYEEVVVDPRARWGCLVMIARRGQNAVVEGRPTLRLFMRVRPGTPADVALAACEDAWTYRRTEYLRNGPVWHEHFTK